MQSNFAFTLIELLIVIGIIALLIGMLLPAINRVRDYSRQIKCSSQLRQIGAAMQFYLNDYHGVLCASQYGTRWLTTTGTIGLIPTQGKFAYWGVAYAPYLLSSRTLRLTGGDTPKILNAAYGIWHCPSTLVADPALGATADDPVSYGINGLITGAVPPKWRRVVQYKNSSQFIFAQDAIKSQMSGEESDTLSDFGTGTNLQEWREGGDAYDLTTAGVPEYYRHGHQSNVLWLDGHVDAIQESSGADVRPEWYLPPDLLPGS